MHVWFKWPSWLQCTCRTQVSIRENHSDVQGFPFSHFWRRGISTRIYNRCVNVDVHRTKVALHIPWKYQVRQHSIQLKHQEKRNGRHLKSKTLISVPVLNDLSRKYRVFLISIQQCKMNDVYNQKQWSPYQYALCVSWYQHLSTKYRVFLISIQRCTWYQTSYFAVNYID